MKNYILILACCAGCSTLEPKDPSDVLPQQSETPKEEPVFSPENVQEMKDFTKQTLENIQKNAEEMQKKIIEFLEKNKDTFKVPE
jgi:hypothetical protein